MTKSLRKLGLSQIFSQNYGGCGIILNDDEWLQYQLGWHRMTPKQIMDAPTVLMDAPKIYEWPPKFFFCYMTSPTWSNPEKKIFFTNFDKCRGKYLKKILKKFSKKFPKKFPKKIFFKIFFSNIEKTEKKILKKIFEKISEKISEKNFRKNFFFKHWKNWKKKFWQDLENFLKKS